MLDALRASYENIQDNLYTSLVLIDLGKAFDTVSQPILSSLKIYSIQGAA